MAVVIGASSIWHAMHAALVDRLMDLALCNVDAVETEAYVCIHSHSAAPPPTSTGPVPPLPTVERRLLSTMLQFAVTQFGTAITTADSTHAVSTNSLGHSIHSKAPTRATKQLRPLSDSDILRPRQHSFHAHTFASAARAAKTPSMTSKHKSGCDSNSDSNSVAPNSAGSSSARLQAANAFLAALQYSAFLESSHLSKSVARAREIRLLNFISFTALCKQLDSEKLRLLFGLEAAVLDSSRSHESLLISDTIQDSLLSLVDIIVDLENKHDTNHSLLSTTDSFHSLADENGGGEPIMRSEAVLFQIAWRAHLAWMDLIVIIVSATEQAGLSGILFAESLVKGIFKGLAQLEKRLNTASSAQLKMVLAVYADTCALLCRTITCLPLLANPLPAHPKHPGVKLLAHPLVLLKHIVNPILRLLLWHDPSCKLHVIQKDSCGCIRAFAATVLKDLVAQIRNACDKTTSIYASKTRGDAGVNVSKNGGAQHVKKVGWKDVSAGAAAIRGVKAQSARDQKVGPPWLIAEAVECTAFVSEFVEIAAEWSETRVCISKGSRIAVSKSHQNNQSEEALQPLLDSKTVTQFVQWALHARPFSTRLAQMFLIPFVEQIAGIGGEENWKACADVIIGVYNGRLAKEKSSGIDSDGKCGLQILCFEVQSLTVVKQIEGPSTINYITKWLVMTSCAGGELVDAKNQEGRDEISFRKSVSKSSAGHKLPNPDSLLNLRKFCLEMLGILTNNNREISLCLLSQFNDREPIIREIASRSLAIRSLNNDSSQLASSSSPVNVVYHRENGQCVFDDPNDACGLVKWFRQTGTSWSRPIAANRKDDRWIGLPSALKSPFKHLIFCLDDAVGMSESLAKSHFENRDHRWHRSTEERAAFGQWAFHIARHMFAVCPVLANPNIYSAAAKAGLHLPIHSDPRHKAFVKVIQELSHRLERGQAAGTDSGSQFTYLNDDQAWCVRQCIAYVAVGILEGSCSSDVIPLCDHRILRALGGLLFDLRRDDSAVLRLIVIEALARVLGAGVLIERVQQAGYASSELFEDIVPALPAQLSQESRESLSIIYRILRCIPPFDEVSDQNQTAWGSYTYDATDGHPRVRSLRDILLSYGEIVHMHAMFNLGDFDTTRFSRSHGLKSFGESTIRREVPSSSSAHEVPQSFEPFQWHRRFSETVISSARNSRMQQRESSMSPLFSKPTKDIPAPVPDEVCSIPLIPVQPPIVQTIPTQLPSEGYSGVLRKIEEEEAQVFQTFNKRLYKSEVGISSQEARAAPLEKRTTPFISTRKELATSSPMVMQTGQEINMAAVPSVIASFKKRSSAFIPKNEGASALFQKTEGFFEDALKSVRSEAELGQNAASGGLSGPAFTRKQCLDEELRFIISEHETGLHQVAQATSSLEEFVSSLKVATIPHVSRHVSEASANWKPATVEDLEKFDLSGGALSLDNWHLVEGEISIRPRTPQQQPHLSPPSNAKQQFDETTRLFNSVSQHQSDVQALMGRNSVPNLSARARYRVDADVIESQDPQISPTPVEESARSYNKISRVEPGGIFSDSSLSPMKLSEDGTLVNRQTQQLKPVSLSATSHPVLPFQSPGRASFSKSQSPRRHSLVLPEERSKELSLNGNELPRFKSAAPLLRNRPDVPSPSPLQHAHQPVEETFNSSVSGQSALIPSAAVSKADQGSQSLPKTDSINASDGLFLDEVRVHQKCQDLEALKWSQSVRNSVSTAPPYQHSRSRSPSITIRPAVSPSPGLSAANIVGKTTSNSEAYASLKSSRSSQQGLLSRSRSSSIDRDASTFTRPVSPLISSRPNISLLGSSRPSLNIGVTDRIEESTEQQHVKRSSMARHSESQSSTRPLQHSSSSGVDGSPSLKFKRESPSPAVKTELVEVRSQQQIPATFADVGTSAINFDEMKSMEFGQKNHVTVDPKVSKLTPSMEPLSVSSKRASSAPFGINDGSFMNSGQKSGEATWLLRRTEIPNSPGSTPLMKSPSQRFPLHRTFSAGAAMPKEAKPFLEHTNPVIPPDTMSEIHNFDESDGLMDLDELTPTKVDGTTVSVFKEAVNLDAFLARNGLQLGGQEDGRTEPSFVSNRIGPSDNLYDQSDLFGQSDFNLDASFGDLSVKLSNDVLNTEVQVPKSHQSPVRDAVMQHRNVKAGDSLGQPTPLRTAQAPNSRTPFTGMSIFADSSQMSNEPSGIPVTPGSPISFSWSAEGQESQLLGRLENASYELDDNDERQISRELAQKQESSEPRPLTHSSTLSFFKSNHSLGNLVSTQSTSMVRPRLRSALELVLRHLVFSQPGQKFGSSYWRENSIDYYELYSDGLVYGSLQHLASFPIAGASGDQRSSWRQELDDEVPVSEPLHGLLKSVFQLDISLMVDLCGPMTMSRNAAEAFSERDNSAFWSYGGTSTSSASVSGYSTAQAMVVVKDQIELSRMTGGNVGLSIMEGLNAGARGSARTFIDWVSVLMLDLSKPRYDQSTYMGRLRHFSELTDPRNLLTTESQLVAAKKLIEDYKMGKAADVDPESVWKAKKLVDSTFHSDTGEKILLPFRMSCFVPTNALIVAGMLAPNPSIAAIAFWQVANQSVNVAFNFFNANKTTEMNMSETAFAYTTAVASSCAIAVGLNEYIKRTKSFSPSTLRLLGRGVPFVAVAAAGTLNVFLMRSKELTDGIAVSNADGEVVGKSQSAGYTAISQVAISRVATSFPAVFLPGLIMGQLERTKFLKSNPRLHMPLNLLTICGSLMAALPCAIALFPQIAEVDVNQLEPRFRNLTANNGDRIKTLYFNRAESKHKNNSMAAETLFLLSQSMTSEPNPYDFKYEAEASDGVGNNAFDSEARMDVVHETCDGSHSLEEMEVDIDLKNHVTGEDLEHRQNKFTKTVFAVQTIVSKKLYKERAVSLELYFKEFWKISRAQVYRFLDCAAVLSQLDGFLRIPTRERLCRTLKCLAKAKPDLRLLWATCLSQMNGNPDAITSTMINSIWDDLVAKRKVLGFFEGQANCLPAGFDEAAWETQTEKRIVFIASAWLGAEYSSAFPPSPGSNDQDAVFYEEPTVWLQFPSSEDTQDETADLHPGATAETVQALSKLEQCGMHLEYYMDGEWKPAQSHYWRIAVTQPATDPAPEPTMLTSTPVQEPSQRSQKKSKPSRTMRSSKSKKAVPVQYDSARTNPAEFMPPSNKVIPVAAEPPASIFFKPSTSKHFKRTMPSDPDLTEEGGDNSEETGVECLSDEHNKVTQHRQGAASRRHRKKPRSSQTSKQQAAIPALSFNYHTTDSPSPTNQHEHHTLQPIIETHVEDCWGSFAPEELEAVAVLQRYRFDKRGKEPAESFGRTAFSVHNLVTYDQTSSGDESPSAGRISYSRTIPDIEVLNGPVCSCGSEPILGRAGHSQMCLKNDDGFAGKISVVM
ncbi:hypothetical protein CcCBS67573_g03756 [Chytriomyces confervae]|uniref:Uncharacterized protein n=1 Tax=Chytriomyces confervae TaxID=246404 RepID=A0A507FFI0_9FUNG|nr:hypothetical protein CcCBS67573_g03756 [Chytriomyces confervae]